MIILREKEFGRTGKSSGQAKMWFEGGNKKQNKKAQREWRQSGGLEEVSNKAKERMYESSPADFAVEKNKLIDQYRKSGALETAKEVDSLRKSIGLQTKAIRNNIKLRTPSIKKHTKVVVHAPSTAKKQTILEPQTPKAIIKEQVGNIKKGVQKVKNSIESGVKGVVKKIAKKI